MRARLTCQRHSYYTLSYLRWFLLLLIDVVCTRIFALRVLLLHLLLLCVCQCPRLAFMRVAYILPFSPRTYGFPRTSNVHDDEQTNNEGDMK